MPDFDALSRNFDYDLWANRRWLACLLGKGFPSPDTAVFTHILGAQQIWLFRVHGESPTAMPKIEAVDSELVRLHTGWKEALATSEDVAIPYRRMTGEEFTVLLSDMAHHVANHGTYHRGELRGLCLARTDTDFPETDFGIFSHMRPPT